mgnify:CR=1 FL=1
MFKYLRLVPTIGVRIVYDNFVHFKPFIKHPERKTVREKWHYGQATIISLLKWLRTDLRIQGLENVEELKQKDIKALYVGNHMSLLDPLVLVSVMDDPMRLVGKKEVKKIPVVGNVLESVDGLFMDREDLKQSLKIILECTKTLKENDRDVVIFPEGTRNKEPQTTMPAPYHVGSFKAATRAGAPIIPFCLYGTFYGLGTKPDFRSVPVELIFGKPIYKEEYEQLTPEELANKVHQWTCEQVEKCRAFEKEYFKERKQKIPYRKVKAKWKGKMFTKYDFDNMKSLD